jgi:hypothetical protein
MRAVIIVGLFVASCSTLVRAEDRSAIETTAYCIGVYQQNIESRKAGIGNSSMPAQISSKEMELRKLRGEAELQQAIRRKIIEYVMAAKITEEGYENAKKCSQMEKCTIELTRRGENKVDQALSDTMTKECRKPFESACESTYKRCD